MKLWDQFLSMFKDDIVTEIEATDKSEPYLTFPCGECENSIVIDNFIFPGDVCVIKCDNCNESWSIYSKPLQISKTSEFEDVWPHIAEDIEQSTPLGEI